MTPEPPTHEKPLLNSLRTRQLASRTAQVARTLNEPQRATGGAFNADAAAALTDWKAR